MNTEKCLIKKGHTYFERDTTQIMMDNKTDGKATNTNGCLILKSINTFYWFYVYHIMHLGINICLMKDTLWILHQQQYYTWGGNNTIINATRQ